jgi:hypothetical protein
LIGDRIFPLPLGNVIAAASDGTPAPVPQSLADADESVINFRRAMEEPERWDGMS